MKITGQTTIYKNEYGNYSTSISNKKEDGTYENMYIAVNFKKGVEIENKTKTDILDGFLTFYTNKENVKVLKLVITDFNEYRLQNTSEDTGSYITIDDTVELPF
jgi:hypothetical protein